MIANPTAVATFAATLEGMGYSPADALARSASLYDTAELTATRGDVERYGMAYAPPHERQQARQRYGYGADADQGTGIEPSELDKQIFAHHFKKRGLGHMLANQGAASAPIDYEASPEDDEVFDKLMKHYGITGQTTASPAMPGAGAAPRLEDAVPPPRQPALTPPPSAHGDDNFSKSDMQKCLQYQATHVGTSWEDSKRALGYPNGPAPEDRLRDSSPVTTHYSGSMTRSQMETALRYQAMTPGTTWEQARRMALGSDPGQYVERYTVAELRHRYAAFAMPSGSNSVPPRLAGDDGARRQRALAQSGTHVLPDSGPSFSGDAAGATEFLSRRKAAFLEERDAGRAERKRMHKLAKDKGIPVWLAGRAMQMEAEGEAATADSAVEKLLERERTSRMFGETSLGLPFSSTTMTR